MRLASSILAVLISAGPALAEGLQKKVPESIGAQPSNLIQWLITAVFVVAALVVAFKPAKRAKLE